MAIPARIRERLAGQGNGEITVTIEIRGQCLMIFPKPEWDRTVAKVGAELSSLDENDGWIKRLFLGSARDITMDGSGRILLPPPLRELVGLQKKGVLLGQIDKLELWDESKWSELRDAKLKHMSSEEMGERLKQLDL